MLDDSADIATVWLPLPLPEGFDYRLPEGLILQVGDQVIAPLGPRRITGLVAALRSGAGETRALKALIGKLDVPALPEALMAFLSFASRWTCSPPGEFAALALRGLSAPAPKPVRLVVATGQPPKRPTPARTKALDVLQTPLPAAEAARRAGVSPAVIAGLIEEGAVQAVQAAAPPAPQPDPDFRPAVLNPSQAAAVRAIAAAGGGFQTHLLDGVTGSGKTEVYLEAAAEVLRRDPAAQVLILLPEIALTEAVLGRFAARFGAPPEAWHSGLSPARRRQTWERAFSGEARITVGARSALFLPFKHLRLIVVDEEHDGAFKQEDGVIYQGRDLAVARARFEGATAILASATPSLESLRNAESGRYGWLRLETRAGGAVMPDIELIDLKANPPEAGQWLSPRLRQRMAETLSRREQVMLFLNRRGYAPLVLCRACGAKVSAPDTDSWLVEHRYSGRLVCHITGFSMPRPLACPTCGAADSLTSVGPGVERIEEEVLATFPEARTKVFSSDTAPTADMARTLVAEMERGEIDILIATQAAAKGHNFPNLTLVGVVDADLGLRGGDLRAAERTFQLLQQASGRAGRADRPGAALLQTYAPEQPVMQALAAGDRDAFLAAEMEQRALSGMPPYGRLAAVILSAEDPAALEAHALELARAAPNAEGLELYGPVDPPLALVRGRRRKRFLLRAERSFDLSAYVAAWLGRVKPRGAVRRTVDMDPYSFL